MRLIRLTFREDNGKPGKKIRVHPNAIRIVKPVFEDREKYALYEDPESHKEHSEILLFHSGEILRVIETTAEIAKRFEEATA